MYPLNRLGLLPEHCIEGNWRRVAHCFVFLADRATPVYRVQGCTI